MIPETTARAPEVFPNSWKFLEMLVKPKFSMICLWGIMDIVGITNISNNFHDSRNYGSGTRSFSKFTEIVGNVGKTNIFHDFCGESWKLLVLPTFPTISMIFHQHCPQVHISRRCYRNLHKVFASLKKLTSWSNTKLGNHLHLKTLLWEHQFMFLAVYHVQSYTPCLRFKKFNIGKLCCTNMFVLA